jgi:hypothetical protein
MFKKLIQIYVEIHKYGDVLFNAVSLHNTKYLNVNAGGIGVTWGWGGGWKGGKCPPNIFSN